MNIADEINKSRNDAEDLRRLYEMSIKLYSDGAHFVYELLQNADDTQASHVKFIQHDTYLEVLHNGIPFNKSNLKSICSACDSDKSDDEEKIGEFGIGFKSVYAVCEKVKIYNRPSQYKKNLIGEYPEFSVEIVNFREVIDIESESFEKEFTTRFIFPFTVAHDYNCFDSLKDLRASLGKRLKELDSATMLFLRYIQTIEYEIYSSIGVEKGTCKLTSEEINDHCRLISSKDKNEPQESYISYLKFSRPMEQSSKRTVDIAFPVIVLPNGEYEFKKSKHPYAYAFFPTQAESKLNFLVQAPYKLTPDRSNISADRSTKEGKLNRNLAEQTAILLSDSIIELRDWGKLNLSFWQIMAVKRSNFVNFDLFLPLYEGLLKIARTENVIPCKNGGYATAWNVKLVRGKWLADLFTDELLTELLGTNTNHYWLSDKITSGELYEFLYDRNGLKIDYIGPDDLRPLFKKNGTFLPNRNNEWLIEFYNSLGEVREGLFNKSSSDNLLTVEFVKTSNGAFIAPYSKDGKNNYTPNVYLPIHLDGLNLVYIDENIYKHCVHFFENILQITKPDEYGCFKARLKARYESGYKVSDEDHIDDVRKILKYINSSDKSEDISQFLNEHFLLRCKKDGKIVYWNSFSEECYFEKSNDNINIKLYFQNLSSKYYADTEFYETNGITYDDLLNLGVKENISHIELSVFSYIANHPDKKDSIVKSQVIFKILGQDVSFYSQWNGQYFNRFGALVKSVLDCGYEWLYSDKMQLVSSKDISKYELNTDIYGKIDYNSDLYNALQFKKNALDIQEDLIKEYAKLSPERKEVFFRQAIKQKFGITLEDLESRLTEGQVEKHFEFPEENVKNLDLLKSHIKELFCYAAPVKYEYVTRHIRTSSRPSDTRTYLKRMYRDENSGTFACQLCHEGFSDLEMCQIEQKPKFEISPLHVCLCPTCAAKFKRLKNNEKGYAEFYGSLNLMTHRALTNEIEKLKFFDGELWFTQVHLAEIIECLSLLKESLRLKQEEFKKSVGKAVKDKKGDVGEIIYVDDACIKVKYKSAEREYKLSMCVENDLLELM